MSWEGSATNPISVLPPCHRASVVSRPVTLPHPLRPAVCQPLSVPPP